MTTEHPKVTIYVPKEILNALDKWKAEGEIESRSAAVVAILADYLGVPHQVQQQGNAPTVPSGVLSTVLAELAKLSDRVVVLEQQMAVSAAPQEVPSPETPSTALSEEVTTANAVPGEAPSTVPASVPLTQMAMAKRLGVSDKAVEKHRKQGKENFAEWSRDRDPDSVRWTWEGSGGRGQPLRFVPLA